MRRARLRDELDPAHAGHGDGQFEVCKIAGRPPGSDVGRPIVDYGDSNI